MPGDEELEQLVRHVLEHLGEGMFGAPNRRAWKSFQKTELKCSEDVLTNIFRRNYADS